MKNKLPFIIIIIVFILGISIFLLFMRNQTLGDATNDYLTKISVDNEDIQVNYLNGNLFNTTLTYGNIFEKVIELENENDKDVTVSINIKDFKATNSLLKYTLYYKVDEDFKVLKEESLLNENLIYNLLISHGKKTTIKIVIKSYYEGNSLIEGEFKVQKNLSSKDIFITFMNEFHNKLIDKINKLNGINTSGIYYDIIDDSNYHGYVLIDARDISEVNYIYSVYNDQYMYVNYRFNEEFKKSKLASNDGSLNDKTSEDICRMYSKKSCFDFNSLTFNESGGKETFYKSVQDLESKINSLEIDKKVYVIDIKSDLIFSDLRGYVLINNINSEKEVYLYVTNDIFMVSGYNMTKLGSVSLDSSTIRAYNESAFNLSSKDMSTVCSYSGFTECYDLQNNLV